MQRSFFEEHSFFLLCRNIFFQNPENRLLVSFFWANFRKTGKNLSINVRYHAFSQTVSMGGLYLRTPSRPFKIKFLSLEPTAPLPDKRGSSAPALLFLRAFYMGTGCEASFILAVCYYCTDRSSAKGSGDTARDTSLAPIFRTRKEKGFACPMGKYMV